jgi:hypothetical protein
MVPPPGAHHVVHLDHAESCCFLATTLAPCTYAEPHLDRSASVRASCMDSGEQTDQMRPGLGQAGFG